MKTDLTFNDMATEEGQMTTVDVSSLKKLPVDFREFPWKTYTDAQKNEFCCLLDDVVALQIPVPKTP